MLPIKIKLPIDYFDEEIRSDFVVTKERKELWSVEMDLLMELERICKLHDLTFFASAGTVLGAVRHGGFIPWDDDIDIVMARDDYDVLCQHASEFNYPYFFQTEYTDPGSLRCHAQLRNSQTTGMLKYEAIPEMNFNQGIFIDIFPLDNIPDDSNARRKFIKKIINLEVWMLRFRNIPLYAGRSASVYKEQFRKMAAIPIGIINKIFNIDHHLYELIDSKMRSYNNTETSEVGIMALLNEGERFIWERSIFEGPPVYLTFEMIKVPVPKGYMELLEKTYGNWREIKKGNSVHGGLITDAHTSYKEYFAIKNEKR